MDDGEEFLASWGKDTVKPTQKIRSEAKRRELQELIRKIKDTARKHGYVPVKVLVAYFKNLKNLQAKYICFLYNKKLESINQ